MSTIGGPGGIGGPKRPGGPDGSSELDEHADVTNVAGEPGTTAITTPAGARIEDVAAAAQAAGATRAAGITNAPGVAPTGELAALAAEVRAGRLTPHEVIDRLVDATAGPGLDATERTELRELLTDLVANDPHLGGLVGRI